MLLRLWKDHNSYLKPIRARPSFGRSAWVCYDITCLLSLWKKPQQSYRSLRGRVHSDNFLNDLYEMMYQDAYHLLHKLYRSGLLCLDNKQRSSRKIQYWITLTGEFAKTQKIEYFKPNEKSIPCCRISLSTHIGTMDMNAIGVRSGKTSRLLQQRLHLLEQLNPYCSRVSQTKPQ